MVYVSQRYPAWCVILVALPVAGWHCHHCVNQRNRRSKHCGIVFFPRASHPAFFLVFLFPFINQMQLAIQLRGWCWAVMLDLIAFWEFAWMSYVCLIAFLYSSFTVEQNRKIFFCGFFIPINIQPNISPTKFISLFYDRIMRKQFTSVGYHSLNTDGFLGSLCRLGAGTVRPTTSADSWHLIWFWHEQ